MGVQIAVGGLHVGTGHRGQVFGGGLLAQADHADVPAGAGPLEQGPGEPAVAELVDPARRAGHHENIDFMTESTANVCTLVELIAKSLVDAPDEVFVEKFDDDVIELDSASGLISIMGGKWTTHRAMAEDTINAAQKALGAAVTESPTRSHVLYGGEGFTSELPEKLAAAFPISKETAHHLSAKFGTTAWEVLELTKQNRNLAEPILAGAPPIQAEVIYSVRHELAATLEDVLARRLGVQFFSWRQAIHSAPVVASLMAQELRWPAEQAKSEAAKYAAKINRYLELAGLAPETVSGASASSAPAN